MKVSKLLRVTRHQKVIAGVVLVVLVAAGGIAYAVSDGGSAAQTGTTIIFSKVQARTLQDTVALNGTLARKQIRNVTAATQGIVSTVNSTNGSTTNTGDVMFAINGRDAVAEQGTVPFFRSLAPGDQGEDVLQLKQILTAAGDYPGPLNNLYTEQTQIRPGTMASAASLPEFHPGHAAVGDGVAGAGLGLQTGHE